MESDVDVEERPIEEVEVGIREAGRSANALMREYALALRREKKMTYREVRKRVIRFFQMEYYSEFNIRGKIVRELKFPHFRYHR
jgi:hypothetical protein